MKTLESEKFTAISSILTASKTEQRDSAKSAQSKQFEIKRIKNSQSNMETILIYIKKLPKKSTQKETQKLESDQNEKKERRSKIENSTETKEMQKSGTGFELENAFLKKRNDESVLSNLKNRKLGKLWFDSAGALSGKFKRIRSVGNLKDNLKFKLNSVENLIKQHFFLIINFNSFATLKIEQNTSKNCRTNILETPKLCENQPNCLFSDLDENRSAKSVLPIYQDQINTVKKFLEREASVMRKLEHKINQILKVSGKVDDLYANENKLRAFDLVRNNALLQSKKRHISDYFGNLSDLIIDQNKLLVCKQNSENSTNFLDPDEAELLEFLSSCKSYKANLAELKHAPVPIPKPRELSIFGNKISKEVSLTKTEANLEQRQNGYFRLNKMQILVELYSHKLDFSVLHNLLFQYIPKIKNFAILAQPKPKESENQDHHVRKLSITNLANRVVFSASFHVESHREGLQNPKCRVHSLQFHAMYEQVSNPLSRRFIERLYTSNSSENDKLAHRKLQKLNNKLPVFLDLTSAHFLEKMTLGFLWTLCDNLFCGKSIKKEFSLLCLILKYFALLDKNGPEKCQKIKSRAKPKCRFCGEYRRELFAEKLPETRIEFPFFSPAKWQDEWTHLSCFLAHQKLASDKQKSNFELIAKSSPVSAYRSSQAFS